MRRGLTLEHEPSSLLPPVAHVTDAGRGQADRTGAKAAAMAAAGERGLLLRGKPCGGEEAGAQRGQRVRPCLGEGRRHVDSTGC